MQTGNRVLIIGLDGMGAEAFDALSARGVIPTLAALHGRGARGVVASTFPPCTCPAWPTMCTGVNPGRHGVFSFIWRGQGEALRIVTAADFAVPRFWRLAAEAGRRCAILYVPTMFPADAVRPLAVSGFPAPSRPGNGGVYPPEAEEELRREIPDLQLVNIHLRWDARPGESRVDAMVRAIREKGESDIRQVAGVFEYASRTPLDLAMVVFSLTDHLFHSYYGCVVAADDAPAEVLALRAAIDEVLHRMDAAIADMLTRFGEPATVLVVSDHGFTRKRATFYSGECLRQAGLLKPAGLRYLLRRLGLGRRSRVITDKFVEEASLDNPNILWPATLAFPAQDHEQGVFVNLKGRNPHGVVEPAEYENVVARVREAFLAVREPVTGEKPVRAVRRREEVYSGPYVDRAPDILIDLADGWHMRSKLSWRVRGKPPAYLADGYIGVHLPDAMLVAAGPAVKPGSTLAGAQLADIAPTALALLGLESALPLDGRPLEEMFTLPGERQKVAVDAAPAATGYSASDEAEVSRRLEELGYL